VLLKDPPVVFAGNLQGRHARETGPRGCLVVSVDAAGRPELDFRPLDVVRWETAGLDAAGIGNGYDLIERFRAILSTYLEINKGVLTVLRVTVAGRTAVHAEIMSDPERWVNEVRAAALDEAEERVWVEAVKLRTQPPADDGPKPEGAVGELLALMDELNGDAAALGGLSSEFADLAKKLPIEFREASESFRPGDPEWLRQVLAEAAPLLVRRLLQGKSGA